MTDPRVPLAKAAGAAWANYDSTVRLGGTKEQRKWAYERATAAEDALLKVEWKITSPKPVPRPAVGPPITRRA